MTAARHSVLASAVLGSALIGSHLVACSADEGAAPTPTPTPTTTSDAGSATDAAAPEAAAPPPTTVSVHLTLGGAAKTSNYVVFYPAKSPDRPVVEPISVGQTVTKEMPDGAHVLFASNAGTGGSAIQIDDVAPGETVELSDSFATPDPAPLKILRKVPPSNPVGLDKRFWSCNASAAIADEETTSDTPTTHSVSHACVEPGGKARFLVTSNEAQSQDPFAVGAIGTAVVDVGNAGSAPVVTFAWAPPARATWRFSGSAPGALTYSARPFFTQSTMPGAFPGFILGAPGGSDSVPPPLSFWRPPAGFNDGELHCVLAGFPPPQGEDVVTVSMLVDRTEANAEVTTDLGAIGPHFLNGKSVVTTAGSVDFDFKPSAEFAPGTVFLTTAVAGADPVTYGWLTLTTRSSENRIRGLVLPDVIRAFMKVDEVEWGGSDFMTAVTGVDARELRTKPVLSITAFGLKGLNEVGDNGGLPRGYFQAKVAQLVR